MHVICKTAPNHRSLTLSILQQINISFGQNSLPGPGAAGHQAPVVAAVGFALTVVVAAGAVLAVVVEVVVALAGPDAGVVLSVECGTNRLGNCSQGK